MNSPTIIDVWPGLAPGETTSLGGANNELYDRPILLDITRPELRIFRADGDNSIRPTLLVLPGGGYQFLSFDHEGDKIAEWLVSIGYNAAVLTYRIPDKRDAAFADTIRSMRTLRSKASEYGINPEKLGTIGFSAGAHLGARLAATPDDSIYEPVDEIDSECARPDFTMMIYAAYLCSEDCPSDEVAPRAGSSPMFLMQTKEDPLMCSEVYAKAAEEVGIDVNLLTYDLGLHGFGLDSSPLLPVSHWPEEAEKWLSRITQS